jgi:hypothetical protein
MGKHVIPIKAKPVAVWTPWGVQQASGKGEMLAAARRVSKRAVEFCKGGKPKPSDRRSGQ